MAFISISFKIDGDLRLTPKKTRTNENNSVLRNRIFKTKLEKDRLALPKKKQEKGQNYLIVKFLH